MFLALYIFRLLDFNKNMAAVKFTVAFFIDPKINLFNTKTSNLKYKEYYDIE